jgi:hypothetical protein
MGVEEIIILSIMNTRIVLKVASRPSFGGFEIEDANGGRRVCRVCGAFAHVDVPCHANEASKTWPSRVNQ